MKEKETKQEFAEKFAERLKYAIQQLNLSIPEVARLTEIPAKTLYKWVSAERVPQIDSLAPIFRIGINPVYLLTGEGSPVIKKKLPFLPKFLPKKKKSSRKTIQHS